jgi:signal peptidase I
MAQNSRIPKIAGIAAIVIACLTALSALSGSLMALPASLIPLTAAIGILRKRVWSAYGFAFYAFAQILIVPIALLRSAHDPRTDWMFAFSVIWSLLLGCFFVWAGRSLARSGASRGRAWPWIAVSAVLVLPFIFFEPFSIPTGAMEDTLLVGDKNIARPRHAPVRGEMIVFRYPVDPTQTFVKRVIGLPGDRIRLSHKQVYRNGVALVEPYATHKMDYEDSYRDDFPSGPNTQLYPAGQRMLANNVSQGEVVVPPGAYFVMGDNRDQSLDSRYWGFVRDGDLIGVPLIIYDSVDPTRAHTRWNRIFRTL